MRVFASPGIQSKLAELQGQRLRLSPIASFWPLSTRTTTIMCVTGLTAAIAVVDFGEPGEVNVSILYGICVGMCAWSQSPRFLWLIATASVILTCAGLLFGPAPITGDRALGFFWADRTFVAVKLLILAIFAHLWMQRSRQLRAASTLMQEKNDALSENLRQSQKLEAIGQLTEGIAHDFKNILTVVIGNLEMIADGRGDKARLQRLAEAALLPAESATSLARRLLAFSRKAEPSQVVHADVIMRRMLPLWRRTLGEAVELTADLPRDLWPCKLDPAQLEATILNLAINARDAMPDGGRLAIRTENVTVALEQIAGLSPGDYILVRVNDNGPGIAANVLPKVFDPFFTTKVSGKGSGLGLWMVKSFVDQCGGAVRIESAAGAGTTVDLFLPRAAVDAGGDPAGDDFGTVDAAEAARLPTDQNDMND